MIIQQSPPEELYLAYAPLVDVGSELADALLTDKTTCGDCGKLFSIVRKPHGIVRIRHEGQPGILLCTWLLCRRCHREAKLNGGRVPDSLVLAARRSYEKLRQLQTQPGGSA